MNNARQPRSWLLGIRGRAAGAALALAIMLVPAVLTIGSAQAQTYTYSLLYEFTGAPDGAGCEVCVDEKGILYGGTVYGGDSACNAPTGCGTVFKLDTTGKETVLYSFTGTSGDGAIPLGCVVQDSKGNLYGTTSYGGDLSCNAPTGCGTVFKLDTTGEETVLYSFTGSPDAAEPESALLRDAQGNLYGTAPSGGAYGYGAVFKVDTTGKETVLYSFTGGTDGGSPTVKPSQDSQGNLYGTTRNGGAYGNGTVFELETTGKETVLYSFTGGADGSSPRSLLRDSQGNLYGATKFGGAYGDGTVYELDTALNLTVLHTFTGGADGNDPEVDVQDATGNLYGSTRYGGDLSCNAPNGCGTEFELDTAASLTVLYTFTSEAGGYQPGGLIEDAKGNLFGSTVVGGDVSCNGSGGGQQSVGCGTVFKLTPTTQTTTTTTLTSAPNPSTYGEAVTFTAVVAPAPPDGETVSFMKGKTVLGTGTLSSGTATFVTSTLKVGTTSVTAVYGGDSEFKGSKSKPVKQVVEKAGE